MTELGKQVWRCAVLIDRYDLFFYLIICVLTGRPPQMWWLAVLAVLRLIVAKCGEFSLKPREGEI
jgi:hypothetical protein